MTEMPHFNDIANPTLRTWNRLNVIYNTKEMLNEGVASRYASRFNKKDKIALLRMAARVANDGYETVRREILRTRNSH